MNDARLKKISELWARAEERLKAVEIVSKAACIPAINELRYSGRQIVDALSAQYGCHVPLEYSGNVDEFIESKLIIAEQYLKNADHDITDAILAYFDTRIEVMLREFGPTHVLKGFPQATEFRNTIAEAYQLVLASRHDRLKRDELYRDIDKKYLIKLYGLYEILKNAEIEMIYSARKIEQIDKRVKMTSRLMEVVVALSFVATAMSLSGLFK